MKRLFQTRFVAALALMAGIVAVVAAAHRSAEAKIEQAVRSNFVAAGLLSRVQVEAERMRRFEKEMFIYAAVADNRAKYVKEFDEAHRRLLALMNETAAPSHKGFRDDERSEMLKWLEATAFYTNEFRRIAVQLDSGTLGAPGEAKGELTLAANKMIGAGKDRFRTLLDGTARMREAKERSSLAIHDEIRAIFRNLLGVLAGIALLVVLAVAAYVLRRPAGTAGAHPRTPLSVRGV
jgi:hypothetical protein